MRWAENHGFTVIFCKNKEGKRLWGIKIKATCRFLLKEGSEEKYYCDIYQFRPKMCREYDGAHEFPGCGYDK
jgi:Fe-S-cluster containining protein